MKRIWQFIQSNFKGIILISLLVLLGGVGVSKRLGTVREKRLIAQATELQTVNAILSTEVKQANDSLVTWERRFVELQERYAQQDDSLRSLRMAYNVLKRSYVDLEERINDVPVEESYQFLVEEAYPFSGEFKFPFNEKQVQGIHLTWLQNIGCNEMNINLKEQVFRLDTMLGTSKNQLQVRTQQYFSCLDNQQKYEKMYQNSEQLVLITEKDRDRYKRQTKFLRLGIWGGTGLGFLLGVIIAK